MRFALVTGQPFTCVCVGCKKLTRAGDNVGPTFADLDGVAFVSYYCEPCKRKALDEQPTGCKSPYCEPPWCKNCGTGCAK